ASTFQESIAIGDTAKPDTASATRILPWLRTSLPISSSSIRPPVDLSLQVMKPTPAFGHRSSAFRRSAGVAPFLQSTSATLTVRPYPSAMFFQRSENVPPITTRISSPGDVRLAIADSIDPV